MGLVVMVLGMSNHPPPQRHFIYLDGLRGIAAFIIALGHFSPMGYIKIGNEMSLWVGFFFILSGFILTKAYERAVERGKLSFRDYVALRLSRLYPLHILTWGVCALLLLFFLLSKTWLHENTTGILRGIPHYRCSLSQTIEALSLTHFVLGGPVCYNTPSWSISVEFWCSLFAFFLFLRGWIWAKGALLVLITLAFINVESEGGFLGADVEAVSPFQKSYVIGLFCFASGWLLAKFTREHTSLSRVRWGVFFTFVAIALSTCAIIEVTPLVECAFFGLCVLIVWCFATVLPPQVQVVRRVLTQSGLLSYSIYLWHVPVVLALEKMILALKVAHLHFEGSFSLQLFYIVSVMALAWASFNYYEYPAKIWLRKKLSHKHAARSVA